MSTIYHNPQCSTSRTALSILRERGEEPEVIKYLDTPPSKETLAELIDAAGLTVHEAIRTREQQYQDLGLSKDTPDDELLDAMVAHPRLIQRPIVVTDKGVRIPRPLDLLDEIL
ncbi:arsenate reductase (glutaredoxin) [Corynebacterium cystitidis]|uniref:arsenate reductase (glutathione/glutaredoxin) n=1 Tax=Corynebacterium cystitidis DSM 20524 TaxID=1121357 RepID=A0A1H9RTV1_9CORY|nr:arsenate reductase (glutaredoxin) [Corynebacterium cystitidis]WJY82082.1 Arsenate reductase [Corynebacterium cystitidis DSM 20524]SER76290.1 arsenate reductase [Corynebacterium cystitidis DSM 20524]SNV79703.1 Arsenate reductase-related protein, glutaredoxin family [Corynebacterium cystitidis]